MSPKYYLHSQVIELCLNNLVIMNIKSDLTKSLNYGSVINEVVNQYVPTKTFDHLLNGTYFYMQWLKWLKISGGMPIILS